MDIQINDNILVLNGKNIKFSHKIRQYKTIGDDVVVLLDIPSDDDTLDNIYCYGKMGIIKWQVQPIKEAFPEMKMVYCYEQMSIINDELCATDFYGRRFFIGKADGKLYKKDVVK